MLITVEYVKRQVNRIDQCESTEEAHAQENLLYYDVLLWIAEGRENAQALAAEAIKTKTTNLDRWCA